MAKIFTAQQQQHSVIFSRLDAKLSYNRMAEHHCIEGCDADVTGGCWPLLTYCGRQD